MLTYILVTYNIGCWRLQQMNIASVCHSLFRRENFSQFCGRVEGGWAGWGEASAGVCVCQAPPPWLENIYSTTAMQTSKFTLPGRGNNNKFILPGRGKRNLKQNIQRFLWTFQEGAQLAFLLASWWTFAALRSAPLPQNNKQCEGIGKEAPPPLSAWHWPQQVPAWQPWARWAGAPPCWEPFWWRRALRPTWRKIVRKTN